MINRSALVGLDFETYGAVDLPKHGLHQYVNDTSFRPLLAALAVKDAQGNMISDCLDFTEDYDYARELLDQAITDRYIVAHNAGFEQAVLRSMGIILPSSRFIDSAMLARAAGAAGKLEAATPQLLGTDKLAVGYELIKLFSIPGKYQSENPAFDPAIVAEYPDKWAKFKEYCIVDAELGLKLALFVLSWLAHEKELDNNAVTMTMNTVGWHVDMHLVPIMQSRYKANVENTVANFRIQCNAPDLNLNSFPQLKAWCADRGVKATSFDESAVERMLKSLHKRLAAPNLPEQKRFEYEEVVLLLQTKQMMGGSSLKKLQTIIDTVGTDGRLHDQYLHIGAGATYRTTGRGVQMQNLKRLNGLGDDMSELYDLSVEWDNDKLASNLRQVFTATDPSGRLIVGDFSSVESRGLAWQAGEQWKIDAYFRGEDLYKVQAGLIFNKPVTSVNKQDRQVGKVGELSCGYGAGPDAVRSFADKMGVTLTEGEAIQLVSDWRNANPKIVDYWKRLDDALHLAIEQRAAVRVVMPHGQVWVYPTLAPVSLRQQLGDPELLSLRIHMSLDDNTILFTRWIHGTRIVGRNIQYFKPSEKKSGDLWSDEFMHPKTKRLTKYTVYGGKLSGLLTQSLCREVFFDSLRDVHDWVNQQPNVLLVGQFHDEIVLDWWPGDVSLSDTMVKLNTSMTRSVLPEFPLAAEIKHDYRYTK